MATPGDPEHEARPLPVAPPVAVPPESRRWPWDRAPVLAPVFLLSLPLLLCCLTSPGYLFAAAAGDPGVPCGQDCGPSKATLVDAGLLAAAGSLVALLVGWSPRVPTAVRIAALVCGLAAATPLPLLWFR